MVARQASWIQSEEVDDLRRPVHSWSKLRILNSYQKWKRNDQTCSCPFELLLNIFKIGFIVQSNEIIDHIHAFIGSHYVASVKITVCLWLAGQWELILKRWYNFRPKTSINEPKILAISNKEDFHGIAPLRILFWVWNCDYKPLMPVSRFCQDLNLFDPNSDLEKETNQWPLIPLKYYTKSTWYYWNYVWADRNCPFSVKKFTGDGNGCTLDWEYFFWQESTRFEAICY